MDLSQAAFSQNKGLTFYLSVTLRTGSDQLVSAKLLKMRTCHCQSLLLSAVFQPHTVVIRNNGINHLVNNRSCWLHLLKCAVTHYGGERTVASHSEAGVSRGVILPLLAVFDKD